MFVLVILGYFAASILFCCGAIECYQAIQAMDQSLGMYVFFTALGEAMLPIFASIITLGLIQICKFLEEMHFMMSQGKRESVVADTDSMAQNIAPVFGKKKKPEPTPQFFGKVEDAPQPQDAPPIAPVPCTAPHISDKEEQKEASSKSDQMSFFHID